PSTLPRRDIPRDRERYRVAVGDRVTRGAGLSSARVVRCWVKSRNERNPYSMLPAIRLGTHGRLPGSTRRKVGTTSNHQAPYVSGFTHATMAGTRGCETVRLSSSDTTGLG